MRILARRNRVLWINSIGNRAPRANLHDAGRLVRKLRAFTQGVREVEPNIFVLAPLAIPAYGSPSVQSANRVLLRSQILFAMKRLGFRSPVSWAFLPAAAQVVGTLGESLIVYQCVDEFAAFSDTNGAQIAALEAQLLAKADLCITSAERLYESKRRVNTRTVMVRHGVDYAHFVTACDERTRVPESLARLPKPVLGFFGLIADWVDLKAIELTARAYPGGSVVLIGKCAPGVDLTALRALPNVHWLGRKPYAELPAYCKGFDVALMPFRVNELTLNANPLKVREYLAAGLPVVSAELPEVAQLGLCKLARSPEEFPIKVAECLAEGAGARRARAERIAHESWEARVREIEAHVARALAREVEQGSRTGETASRLSPA